MLTNVFYIFTLISVGLFSAWLGFVIVIFLVYSLNGPVGFEGLLYIGISLFFGFVDYSLWLLWIETFNRFKAGASLL